QPFTVQQMGASELATQAGAAKPLDCLLICRLRSRAVAAEGAAARLDAQRPVGPSSAGRLGELLQRSSRTVGHPSTGGGLDELDPHLPGQPAELRRVSARGLCRRQRVLVATQAVVEQRSRPLNDLDSKAFTSAEHFLADGLEDR